MRKCPTYLHQLSGWNWSCPQGSTLVNVKGHKDVIEIRSDGPPNPSKMVLVVRNRRSWFQLLINKASMTIS